MLGRLRGRTGVRRALVLLAFLALALKTAIPPGFMPGSSLSAPIVICTGQAAVMAMTTEHGGRHHPSKTPQQGSDHPCAFAGLGATPLAPDVNPTAVVAAIAAIAAPTARDPRIAPGRGMAAPPPPSHAPPSIRA